MCLYLIVFDLLTIKHYETASMLEHRVGVIYICVPGPCSLKWGSGINNLIFSLRWGLCFGLWQYPGFSPSEQCNTAKIGCLSVFVTFWSSLSIHVQPALKSQTTGNTKEGEKSHHTRETEHKGQDILPHICHRRVTPLLERYIWGVRWNSTKRISNFYLYDLK